MIADGGSNGIDLWVALVGFAGMIITSGIALIGARRAGAANRAVNGRPDGEPSIYDLVHQIDAVGTEALAVGRAALTQATEANTAIGNVDRKLDKHLAWHQIDQEKHDFDDKGTGDG